MPNREHLMCLAAFSALVALSGAARADDYSIPDTSRFARSEELARPMTCAQAQAFAWFKRQMELSDGGQDDREAALPAECERTNVAKAEPKGDREVNDDDGK
jgi:hypothetical protein